MKLCEKGCAKSKGRWTSPFIHKMLDFFVLQHRFIKLSMDEHFINKSGVYLLMHQKEYASRTKFTRETTIKAAASK
jgi:hypothetical protein